MRRQFIWPLLLLTTHSSFSQVNGNEWIVTGQSYFKIPITQPGIFQITRDQFRRADISLDEIDPRTVQLFHRGREQAIQVVGESDGQFDAGDVILFRGQGNDGVSDSVLYRPASAQTHPFYSLFSDTTYYFLTWQKGIQGLRQRINTAVSVVPASQTALLTLTTDYRAGTIYPLGATLNTGTVMSHYEEGEGWTGLAVTGGQRFSVVIPFADALWADTSSIQFQGWVVGRNPQAHTVNWIINGRPVGESRFENYQSGRFEATLSPAMLGRFDALTVTVEPQQSNEQVSLSAVRVVYVQKPGVLPPVYKSPELIPVRFRSFAGKPANYWVITHPRLRQSVGGVPDPVRAYAEYRASLPGGRYDTLTVHIGELFDQFNYGERSPVAIRRFVQFMLNQSGSRYNQTPHLFLIGQSRDPQGVRTHPNAARLDLLPNGGWPGSDVLLVEGLNGEPRDVPAVAVGRLNTDQPQTVLDYLTKVREYESDPRPALWRKTLLHVSGGRSAEELSRFRRFVDGFAASAKSAPLGAEVHTRSKQTDEPVEVVPVADRLHQGVGLLTVFGHSGLDITDVDLGFASDDRRGYHNKGQYPFLLVNGCAAGNVFFGRPTFGTDWVTTPDRGAIGFLAHTFNGFPEPMQAFTNAFYTTLNDLHWQAETIGRAHRETIRRYLEVNSGLIDRANAQQFLLQGDPAIRLFSFDKPDFAFGASNQLSGLPKTDASSADSLLIRFVLTNAGRAEMGTLPLRIRQYTPEGQWLNEQLVLIRQPLFADTLSLRLPTQGWAASAPIVELRLNPDEHVPESNYTNNLLILGGTTPTELPFPPDLIPPLVEVAFDGQRIDDNAVVTPRPLISLRVRDDNPRLLRRDTTGLLLYLQRPEQAQTGLFERLFWHQSLTYSEEGGRAFRVNFQPDKPWPDGQYTLEAYARDLSGNSAAPYRIQFRIAHEPRVEAAGVAPNPVGITSGKGVARFFCLITGMTPPETIQVTITNLVGQIVYARSLPGRIGTHEWLWDGTDAMGNPLSPGLYFYQFQLTGPTAEPYETARSPALSGRVLLTP